LWVLWFYLGRLVVVTTRARTALVVLLAPRARIVTLCVALLLLRHLVALARVRVAVGAAERIGVLLVPLVAAAGRADVGATGADTDALIVLPLALRAEVALALCARLTAAAAVSSCLPQAEAVSDDPVAVVAGDASTSGTRRGRGLRCRRSVVGCGGHLERKEESLGTSELKGNLLTDGFRY
jgi:hypothetical protein